MDTERRLIELEAKVAHQDQAISELSEEIYRQQKQIVRLEEQARQLIDRLRSVGATAAPTDPSSEIPPHY